MLLEEVGPGQGDDKDGMAGRPFDQLPDEVEQPGVGVVTGNELSLHQLGLAGHRGATAGKLKLGFAGNLHPT